MQEILSKVHVGERIKNLRIEHNLSQAVIANILNISRSNYSQIELGNQFPSFDTLHLIARYYSKSYEWILHGEQYNLENIESVNNAQSLISSLEKSLAGFKKAIETFEQELIEIKTQKLKGNHPE
nr:helix-turn-helix transcriptional regulator [Pedobacter panaciterrae]